MKITKNTTDLKIGSVLKAIMVSEGAPFKLSKFYKITNGDCVGEYEINNVVNFGYSINELGNFFEYIATLDDIEDLEKKALILKETFEQFKILSESAEDEISDEALINETIAFLVQDEVYQGDEIELQFICDNMDISMVEKCSCCGEILLPDDECYSDDNNDGEALCDHCSIYDEDDDMYIKTVHQDVLESITGLKFSHLVGNVGAIVENFNNWLNENKYGFGIFDDSSKARFVEFLTEQTELNICDICGQIEKTEDLNWSDEDLFDEDYQNFRFLQGTKIAFESICDDCLNSVNTLTHLNLKTIVSRLNENNMIYRVDEIVLLENVNFKQKGIKRTSLFGTICSLNQNNKTYKLKEFGEQEFKDDNFFDILNSAFVGEYVEFIAAKHTDLSDKVDEWSYPNCEGHPDIKMAFENFGYKEEFIEYLKSNDLPYGRFLTPKFIIGDEFNVHFNHYDENEITTHKIARIDSSFTEFDDIVYWSDEFVYITESELSNQKNPKIVFDEVKIIKDDLLHNLFCLEEENGILVPTFDELISAKEILSCWKLCEKYEDFSYDSVISEINEQCEDFFIALVALDTAKNKEKQNKKYNVRQIVEYGVSIEIIEELQNLHKTVDKKELDCEPEMIVLQSSISTKDFSSIEIVLDCDIDYSALSKYLKKEVEQSFYKEVNMLIEVIKEAKYDKHNTLHLYDC